ncbi:glycyl-radical enzyme activating protein [Spirochaetia bacterium]|nr:glycyl-radical enzyme activating protein [Spirochaetia bacterium]
MDCEGIIFDIQRFAVHDGPGIRSTVFLKGCTCAWCHNPESLSVKPQIEFYPSRCIGCGKCFTICPERLHTMRGEAHHIDRTKCSGCGRCAAECFSNALVLKGKKVSSGEIMETLLKDRVYFEESGGGVTLSGGEPALQSDFSAAILSACKQKGIHTAIQTAGNYPFEKLEALLPHLDMIMYDIKGFSPDIYTKYIRGNREQIFKNLKSLGERFKGVLAVRTPCVGSVNDNEAEIEQITKMLAEIGNIVYYQIIPYHGLGKAKYDALNEAYTEQFYTPSPEKITAYEKIASRFVPVFNIDKGVHYGELSGKD